MILSEPVLVDTGALLAIYNVHDVHHAACVEQAEALPTGKIFTCWPVVTEALYMLRKYPDKRDHLLQRLATEELQVVPLWSSDVDGVQEVFETYDDQDVDFADACLVHLGNREEIETVFTVDRRHFGAFRRKNGQPDHPKLV